MRRRERRGPPPRAGREDPDEARLSLAAPLRARFPGGLPEPPPEPPPQPPPPTPMSEAEVMAAIFRDEAGVDFDAIRIVSRAPRSPGRPRSPKASTRAVDPPVAGADPRAGPGLSLTTPASAVSLSECTRPQGHVEEVIQEAPTPSPVAALATRAWAGAGWRDAPPAPPADVDVLSDPQRHLLAAARRQPRIPALRLRGLRRDAAIDALADFLALRRAVGDRIVRVITGKGIGSPGEPVLKAAVVAWCAGEGADVVREWAPERERDGCYGALILALRPR